MQVVHSRSLVRLGERDGRVVFVAICRCFRVGNQTLKAFCISLYSVKERTKRHLAGIQVVI